MDARGCGACSVCCTVLRVDELAKLGGVTCLHQRAEGGCAIHPRRPAICRAYACLWLRGSLDDVDRPDRLGAVLDLASRGGLPELVIHEAAPGAFDGVARLREIAEAYRASMPVRMHEYGEALDPDRRFRVLLPGGEEQRVAGERVELWREGAALPSAARGSSAFAARRRWRRPAAAAPARAAQLNSVEVAQVAGSNVPGSRAQAAAEGFVEWGRARPRRR
jgi:hypothetical protein